MVSEIKTEGEKLKGKITIGKNKYKVYICESLKLNDINHFGLIQYENKLIFLKRDEAQEETLKHEIIHGIIHETYLESKLDKKLLKRLRSNEPFIESLSFLFEQYIKRILRNKFMNRSINKDGK